MEIQHIFVQFTYGAPPITTAEQYKVRTRASKWRHRNVIWCSASEAAAKKVCLCAECPLAVPAVVTLKMYTFCPQNSFVCVVRVAEHTTIISTCSIKWLVFITETESVYCAVRAEYLKPLLMVLIAGLSPPWRGFDARSVHVRFVVDKGDTWTSFSPSTSVFFFQWHRIHTPHSFLSTCCS